MFKMNIKQKSALFPAMTIITILIVGAFSYLWLGRLNSSIEEVHGSLTQCQEFSSIEKDLLSIQGDTFKLIAWTVSEYPKTKIDELTKDTLQALSILDGKIQKKAQASASQKEKESLETILKAFAQYRRKVADAIDMVSVDSAAASSYMGSVDEQFNFIRNEMGKWREELVKISSQSHEEAKEAGSTATRRFIGAMFGSALLGIILTILITRSILKPS